MSSPAIDRDMFRAGEVTRIERDFAGWRMVCDEVKKLRQRFCSLRSLAFDARGKAVASIVVSTGDNGRPAALITLPLGITLGKKVLMTSAGIKGRAAPVKLDFNPLLCTTEGCKIIWSLTPADIDALRGGANFHLAFAATPALHDFPGPVLVQWNARVVAGRIAGAGFDAAIAASVQ